MAAIPRFRISLSNKDIAELRVDLTRSSSQKKDEVEKFERLFAAYIRRKQAIFFPSARTGLFHILKGLNLKPGDGVIVPAWTHFSVPAMIAAADLRPMFADIEGGTYNMTHNTVPKDYWRKAKAIIITNLYGCPAPVEELKELAEKHNLIIIEDCAQSLGATVHGTLTGAFGVASIFSLSITKNLTTLKGGMICTDDPKLASHLRSLRMESFVPGSELSAVLDLCEKAKKYTAPAMYKTLVHPALMIASIFGIDPIHDRFREKAEIKKPPSKVPMPNPIQAILGNRKIKRLDRRNEARNRNGKFLLDNLKGIKGVIIPRIKKGHYHIFMSFVLMVEEPMKVKKELLFKGIDTSPGYLRNCANMKIFDKFHVRCKMAERMERMQIHIPVYPGLSKDELTHVARSIVDICAK